VSTKENDTLSEAYFDHVVECLHTAESEMEADKVMEAMAEARCLLSGINRFHGDLHLQTRYMMAVLACFHADVPPEIACLAAVEYAETGNAVH
jgi:hypothetical protein